mgnify:FL=1
MSGGASVVIHVHHAPPPAQYSLQLLLHGLDAAGKPGNLVIDLGHLLLPQVLCQLLVGLVLHHLGERAVHVVCFGCEGKLVLVELLVGHGGDAEVSGHNKGIAGPMDGSDNHGGKVRSDVGLQLDQARHWDAPAEAAGDVKQALGRVVAADPPAGQQVGGR